MDKVRDKTIDIFRGICIFCMVLGHSWVPFVNTIYLFHMPSFFVASGYTYNINKKKIGIGLFIWNKICSLLIPFWLVNTIFILIYKLLEMANILNVFYATESFDILMALKQLFLYGNPCALGGATWFLPVLFGGSILFHIYNTIGEGTSYIITVILSAISLLLGIFLIQKGIRLIYCGDLIFLSVGFIAFGDWLKRYQVLEGKIPTKIMFPCALISTWFFGTYYFNNLPMNWPSRQFTNSFFIQTISCFMAMYVIWILACEVKKIVWIEKIFEELGKRTYVIMTFHFAAFKLIFWGGAALGIFDWKYVREQTPWYYPTGINWLIFSCITVLICWVISCLAEKSIITNYIFNARRRK